MRIKHIISDADGVLINSQKLAWISAQKIISLFHEVAPFQNLTEFKNHFGRQSQIDLVGEKESETLRSMHRLLMRHNSSQIEIFHEVVEIYKTVKQEMTIVTSAFATGIINILGENAKTFTNIFGRESGRKSEILKRLVRGDEIYITDSVRDIITCQEVGLPVIAVGWGYDNQEELNSINPDYFVKNPNELYKLFNNLKLN
jgi:phosphoglycolate phosphatase-like HAD superfamily hydrolase